MLTEQGSGQPLHSCRSGKSVPQSKNRTDAFQRLQLELLINAMQYLSQHANLGVVKCFCSLSFDSNTNSSRGIVRIVNGNTSTRGIKLLIYFEGGKPFAQNWWCLSALHHSEAIPSPDSEPPSYSTESRDPNYFTEFRYLTTKRWMTRTYPSLLML